MNEQERSPARPSVIRRGVLFTGSGAILSLFFLFLETAFAVRVLSAGSYGIYVLLIAVVNFLIVAIDFGCKTAVTKIIASSDSVRQAALVNSAIIFRLLIIAAISAVMWLAQDLLLRLDSTPGLVLYLGYAPVMIAVASLDELFAGMLQGFRAYRRLAIAQIGRGTLRLCLTIVFLSMLDLGIRGMIYSWVLSFALSTAYQYLILPVSKRLSFRRQALVEMLRFGLPLQMTRFLWLVFRRIDVLLLGMLAGPTSAAYYEVAARIPDALQRLSESFTTVYFPTMASLLAAGKREEATWTLNQSLRLLSFLTALSAMVAVLFSHRIITLLFSDKYEPSRPTFMLLMIAFQMTFIVNLMGYTLTSAGHPGRSLVQNLARSTLNVVGDLILIPIYSFAGPALATLIALYAANPLGAWLLHRSGVEILAAPYVKQTLILLLCTGLFWWFQPAGLVYKTAILTLFVGLNVVFATISRADLRLLSPSDILRRPALQKESLPHGN